MNIEQELQKEYDWDNAPVIVRINEYEYRLGPQAPDELDWDTAVDWCESIGGELPERQILLMCYLNEKIKSEFVENYYWSSTEFSTTYACIQNFANGNQYNDSKTYSIYVRAIRKYAI